MKMSTRRLLTNHPATYVNPDRSRVRQASYSEIQDLYTSKGDTSKSTRVEKYERHEDLRYLGYSNHTISNIGEDNNNFDTSNFFRPKNGVGHSNFDHSNLKRANKGAQTNNFDHLKLAKNSDTDAEVLMKSSTEIDRIIANWAKFSSSQNEMASRHFEQGSTRNDDLVCSDNDSSVLSTRDKTHYSEKLKEFENMVQTCNANGEYVYLSQVNGSKDNEYSTIVKRRNRSNEIREEEVFTVVKRRHRSNDVNTKTQGEYSTVVKPRNKSTEVSVTTQGEYSTVVKTRNKISAGVDLSLVDSITDKENRRTSPRDSDAGMTGVSSERIVQCEYNGNLSGEASNISDVVGSAEGDYVTVCDVNKNMNLFKLPEPRNKRDRCVNIISGVKKVVNQDSHLNNGNIQDDIDGRYNERVNRREDIGVKKVVNQDRHAYKGNLQGDINGETDEMVNIYDDIEGKKVFNQAAKHNNAGKIHGAIDNMNGDLATSERTDINTLVDQESVKSDADAEDDLKKIIQECLWYFHSQVETQRSHNHHGSRGYSRSHSQSESQAPGLQIDRRYWSSNLKKRTRPRSLTDSTFGTSVGNERHRPRSLTETEPLQSYQRNEVDSRKSKERDVSKQGDGLSLVADVSSRHGSQHTPRVQTLPPRIPAYSSTPAVRRLNQRESSSIRRRPHLERRSKSATVGMSVTSHDTYIHTQKQPDPISKGRMFIEDVLNDISDPKGMDNEDHYTSRENGDGIVRDFDNNEIKSAPHGQNGRVSSTIADTTFRSRFVDTTTSMPRSDVSSFPAPLYRSKSEFHVNVDSKYLTEDGSRHCKSLRSDARSQKPLPNLTKDSKFIRSLSLSKLTSDFKDSHLHDNKNGKSKINCVDYSDKISSVDSSPSDFGVFDIVGEDSGCLYPWQRDASTQYEPVTAVAVDDSQHESNDIQSNTVDEAGDTISKTHQGINTSDIAIVKRQKMFRTNRPHSMGCIDTATFDNELASITNLHSNARARNSEPFIQSPFQRKKSSRGNSDDSSTSNLEAILETSADITLKNCAYRNVLSSPSVSPEMFRDRTELEDSDIVTDEFDEPVFDSPVGKRRKVRLHDLK